MEEEMAVYTLNVITKDVRIALDQNAVSSSLVAHGDIDTLSLNDIIKSKILDGVRRIHSIAPSYLLVCGCNFGDAIYWGASESGYVLLPNDFMRLISFKMSDWERPVYKAIDAESPEYAKRSSRIKAIRGTAQNPVCVLAVRPEGRVLEFYSCKSEDADVSRAIYLPYPKFDDDDGVKICSRCYQSIVYTIAALVLASMAEIELSKTFFEIAQSALI